MSVNYMCAVCDFWLPADEIGEALMLEHQIDKHGYPNAKTARIGFIVKRA